MTTHSENHNFRSTKRAFLLGILGVCGLVSCQQVDTKHHAVVSAAEQRMVLLEHGKVVGTYPVSTSKFGLGDQKNSYRTPIGKMVVAKKVGGNLPSGAVLKSRQWTGEVLPPNAPGRDPILSRILWLKGRESQNRHAFGRLIYIHGTTEENRIGYPVSFGCVRMKSADVIDLYNKVRVGTPVTVLPGRMPMAVQTAEMRSGLRKWTGRDSGLAKNAKEKKPIAPDDIKAEADVLPLTVRESDSQTGTPTASTPVSFRKDPV
ncbi:MAG: L,D-transpeptidase [Verrucomicrobiales bacterium]